MMVDETLGGAPDEKSTKFRAVQEEADRLGGDARSLGQSVVALVQEYAREKPLKTVAIAMAIGWVFGRRIS